MHAIARQALQRHAPGTWYYDLDAAQSGQWGHQPGQLRVHVFDWADPETRQSVVWDQLQAGFEDVPTHFVDGRWTRDDLVPFALVGAEHLGDGHAVLFLDVGNARQGRCPVVLWDKDTIAPDNFRTVAGSVEELGLRGHGEPVAPSTAAATGAGMPPTPMQSAAKSMSAHGKRAAKNAAWRAVTSRLPRPLRILLAGRGAVEREATRAVNRKISSLIFGCGFTVVVAGLVGAVLLFVVGIVGAALMGLV